MDRSSSSEFLVNVCNQMIKGPTATGGRWGNLPESLIPEKVEEFYSRWSDLVEVIVEKLPPNATAAFGAVICKCAIWYGLEKTLDLLNVIRTGTFKGENDPAYLLWFFLNRNQKLSPQKVQQKVISGARAFCEGRTINRLRFSATDIFEWNRDFTKPKKFVESQANQKESSVD